MTGNRVLKSLYLPAWMWVELETEAKAHKMRSVNNYVEYVLKDALRRDSPLKQILKLLTACKLELAELDDERKAGIVTRLNTVEEKIFDL